jgi:hypothetical protein
MRSNGGRTLAALSQMGARVSCQTENGAVTSAVLVHLRVESAHFDWRWRERPALARLAWEAVTRDPLERPRRIQVESIGSLKLIARRGSLDVRKRTPHDYPDRQPQRES